VIDRRMFFGALASGMVMSPFATFAQVPARVPRIGILGNDNAPVWDGFRQGMRELGYVDGRTVALEWRWAEGKTDRYPGLAGELVALKVDVIVTSSTQAARAAKQATSTIPIVMTISAYPDRIGLVDSLARPGGNITGSSNVSPELMGKRLQLLKEIAPKVRRVAILWNPASPVETLGFADLQAASAAAGVDLVSVEVRSAEDYAAAFSTAMGADALHAFGNPVNFRNRQLIADFALGSRLPGSFEERIFVDAGGLFSYAPSFFALFRRAAAIVDRILKGAKPADIPIEQPTSFELVINLSTAKALGLALPQQVLMRASDVVQ